MPRAIDLRGQHYGMLTALEPTEQRDGSNVIWKCRCDCGKECYISVRDLRGGRVVSCGCYKARNLTTKPRAEKLGQIDHTNLSRLRSDKVQRNSTTGVTGVCQWSDGRYEAYIFFRRHKYRLGFFDTLAEAARARAEAKERIHNEYLNHLDHSDDS